MRFLFTYLILTASCWQKPEHRIKYFEANTDEIRNKTKYALSEEGLRAALDLKFMSDRIITITVIETAGIWNETLL